MRIKRQRRKLRGKYSGNCLSCSAKWSKCWYIASIENQKEWEARLSKVVTPCTDEVCFQCWDAKIRTSPKRKIHFKAELPAVVGTDSPENTAAADLPSLRPAKRVDRNKRRALNGDFEFSIHTSDFPTPHKGNTAKTFEDYSEDEGYANLSDESDNIESTSIYEESIIFDEENAVILLSTAFRTIPHHISDVNINININTYHDVDDLEESADDKAKRRGAYYCGKCGKLKKGHVCDAPPSPKPECEQSSSPVPPPSPTTSLLPPTTPPQLFIPSTPLPAVDIIALAQPVVS